ncbi:Hypothetical protein, putative [Bodo saltans]|uniref:tRNA-dihydrouridine(16/17) synthase [NAD(P)(+)] n=1 Tax=Bodo saltans TaxID=75058 RepID=A0A0S4JUA9_BODSA|nr:Hypothetical protein, putative [Bodo saltans]|eukprot:CUG93604.1 Hypothetical protein, putative [Bodo saltans]
MAYNKKLLRPYYEILNEEGACAADGGSPCAASTAAAQMPVIYSDNGSPTPKSEMYRDAADNNKWKCRSCPYCNGERDATVKYPKMNPHDWWREVLKSPKYVVAPMVDASELPFRMLCRKYGADLAYTPMFHSRSFMESAEYRRKEFSTCPEDRPLFVQFCGHDGDTVLAAAKHVEDDCDAVDLNLGCPQGIARRGFYGAYLMEHWDLVHTIIHTLFVELKVAVTAKMRLFDDMDLTLAYAEMIRDAGAQVIGVHGRTREMKGQQTGMADVQKIRMVRDHVGHSVPVIENGNVLTFADVEPNLVTSGCQAVMSAEALLWDPRLFSNPSKPVLTGRTFHCTQDIRLEAIQTAKEYLKFVQKYPVELGFAKGHLFKILYHTYELFQEMRVSLGDFECTDADVQWLVDHVEELERLEHEKGIPGALVKTTTAEKRAAKDAVQSAAVEEAESYFIDFSTMM